MWRGTRTRRCSTCRWFINGWCALEILDRAPQVRDTGDCPAYEPKDL